MTQNPDFLDAARHTPDTELHAVMLAAAERRGNPRQRCRWCSSPPETVGLASAGSTTAQTLSQIGDKVIQQKGST
jgi:pyridoxine/pyridoxamine 5'-phosphate oxidase